MNNPTIYKIEYQYRDTVNIDSTVSDEVGSECFSGVWNELDIAPTTGELADAQQNEKGMIFHVTTVNFFIAGINTEQKLELNTLASNPAVYRITDGENKQYILGSEDFRAWLSFGEQISPTAEGRKGYNCSISCKSLHGPLVYNDTASS